MRLSTKVRFPLVFVALSAFALPVILTSAVQASAGRVVVWQTEERGLISPSWPLGILCMEGWELTNAIALAAGSAHALILCDDGRVIAIGDNAVGQGVGGKGEIKGRVEGPDGRGPYRFKSTFPPSNEGFVRPGGAVLTGVVEIAAAAHHNLALRGNGTVVGWGSARYGIQPYVAPSGLRGLRHIACGLDADWFLDGAGHLIEYSQGRAQTISTSGKIVAIAATKLDRSNFAAIQENGEVVTGSIVSGVRSLSQEAEPLKAVAAGWQIIGLHTNGRVTAYTGYVPEGLTNISKIAVGSLHTLCLTRDGKVIGWNARQKQLLSIPQDLSGVVAIAVADDNVSLAITTNSIASGPHWWVNLEEKARHAITADQLQSWATNLISASPSNTVSSFSPSQLCTNFPAELARLSPFDATISVIRLPGSVRLESVTVSWSAGAVYGHQGFELGPPDLIASRRASEWKPGVYYFHTESSAGSLNREDCRKWNVQPPP